MRRLTAANERLEEQLTKTRTENVKSQGESQTSSATITRLQAQLNGAKNDYELAMKAKQELEKLVK